MASTTLMYRRALRTLREQPLLVRVTAAVLAAVLIIDLAALGAKSTSSGGSNKTTAGGRRSTVVAGSGLGPLGSSASSSDASGVAVGAGGGVGGGSGGSGGGGSVIGAGGGGPAGCPDLPRPASDDHGVTADEVSVEFPWFDINQYTSVSGTSPTGVSESQPDAIAAYVDWVNHNVCLGGRQINAHIDSFNPLNEGEMDDDCIKWTEDDKVFAVVDSSAWHSNHQLCITDHNTPLVTQLGLTNKFTNQDPPNGGRPYLWYTAPTTEETIDDWVSWMIETGQLTAGDSIGMVVGTRPEEKDGEAHLKAALDHFGLKYRVGEIPGVTTDVAEAQPFIAQAIANFKQPPEVNRLLVGLTALSFATWAKQADTQQFWPRYELSDWNTTIVVADSLISGQGPQTAPDAFRNGALGPTFMHLGEVDVSKGGTMTPREQLCADIWKQKTGLVIDRAGVAMRWCDNIFMFAEGLSRAIVNNNGAVTRLNWTEAMATVQGVQGGMTTEYSWAQGDFSGPTQTKIVELHIHEADFCMARGDSTEDEFCLAETRGYEPMRTIPY